MKSMNPINKKSIIINRLIQIKFYHHFPQLNILEHLSYNQYYYMNDINGHLQRV